MKFNECFEVKIVKAYKKLIRRQTEEGTFIVIVNGKLFNSKTEWHQPKIVRTTIHTGEAELAEGRIVSFLVDCRQRTQENRPLPPPPPRRGGQGSASQQLVREAPTRSTRKRNDK